MSDLIYSKTPEQEFEENLNALVAEEYLKRTYNVKTTTNYGYYRNTFDILKDLGSYLVQVKKVVPSDYVSLANPAKIAEDVQ